MSHRKDGLPRRRVGAKAKEARRLALLIVDAERRNDRDAGEAAVAQLSDLVSVGNVAWWVLEARDA